MSGNEIIAGMWGTTTLRASLLTGAYKGSVTVVETREGPGASRIDGGKFECVIFGIAADWLERYAAARIILAGMVGSTIGWRDVGYVQCPADLTSVSLHDHFVIRNRNISILKGLSCRNIYGEPDVMRGEETELLGWIRMADGARRGEQIVCIPGTHTKWIHISGSTVVSFLTSVPGEAFAAFRNSGVLISQNQLVSGDPTECFRNAARDSFPENASLIHQLFSVRARCVAGADADADGPERLSGLLIGADVSRAIRLLRRSAGKAPVTVIGAPGVGERYRIVLEEYGVDCSLVDAEQASSMGFWAARANL